MLQLQTHFKLVLKRPSGLNGAHTPSALGGNAMKRSFIIAVVATAFLAIAFTPDAWAKHGGHGGHERHGGHAAHIGHAHFASARHGRAWHHRHRYGYGYGSCWRSRLTSWGWSRVWVCGDPDYDYF